MFFLTNSFNKLTSGLTLIDIRINENKFGKWHTNNIKTNGWLLDGRKWIIKGRVN